MSQRLEIGFGDVHSYTGDNSRRYVIVDVGEGSWFAACEIVDASGRLGIAGTGGKDNIAAIIGKMGIKEIIKGIEMTLGSVPRAILEELTKSSLKPPRFLE